MLCLPSKLEAVGHTWDFHVENKYLAKETPTPPPPDGPARNQKTQKDRAV